MKMKRSLIKKKDFLLANFEQFKSMQLQQRIHYVSQILEVDTNEASAILEESNRPSSPHSSKNRYSNS